MYPKKRRSHHRVPLQPRGKDSKLSNPFDPCTGFWSFLCNKNDSVTATTTTHSTVTANPTLTPTTSVVVNISTPTPTSPSPPATGTDGSTTSSLPPTTTGMSTQVILAADSHASSSTVDSRDPGSSGLGGYVLSSSTNPSGVPYGSDPTFGAATVSGTGTSGSSPPPGSNTAKGTDVGGIVGGVIGTISFLLLLLLALWLIRRRRRGRTAPSAEFLASPRRPFARGSPFRRIGSIHETYQGSSTPGSFLLMREK